MTAFPVALACDKRVEQVRLLTQQCVEAWRVRWDVPLEATVAASAWDAGAGDGATAHEGWVACAGGSPSGVLCPPDLGCRISEAVFGDPGEAGSLAEEAGEHVAQELLRALFRSWGGEGAFRPVAKAPAMSRWRAPVRVEVRLAGLTTLVALVSALSGSANPLSGTRSRKPLPRAEMQPFDALPVQARLHVGAAEISVPEAAGLQVGDVIVLDSLIHEPLELRLPSDTASLPVFLGRTGAARAALMAPVSKS
jgi:flagellar motor switch/type III secretory pathway protein FliN